MPNQWCQKQRHAEHTALRNAAEEWMWYRPNARIPLPSSAMAHLFGREGTQNNNSLSLSFFAKKTA